MSLFAKKFGHRISTEDASPEREIQASASVSRAGLSGEEVEQIVEVERVAAEGELLTEEMDVLTEERQGLEAYRDAIRATLSEGGLTPQAASMVRVGLEGVRRRIGLNLSFPSTESFGAYSDRLSMTELSLEGAFIEGLKKIWKAIKEAISKAWNWILELFGKGKEEGKKLKDKFDELAKRDIKGSIAADAKDDLKSYADTFRDEKAAKTNKADVIKFIDSQSKLWESGKILFLESKNRAELESKHLKELESAEEDQVDIIHARQVKETKELDEKISKASAYKGSPADDKLKEKIPSDTTFKDGGYGFPLFKGLRNYYLTYTDKDGTDCYVFGDVVGDKDDTDYSNKKIDYADATQIKSLAEAYSKTLEAYTKMDDDVALIRKELEDSLEKMPENPTEEQKKKIENLAKIIQSTVKFIMSSAKIINSNFVSGAAKVYEYLDKSANAHKES